MRYPTIILIALVLSSCESSGLRVAGGDYREAVLIERVEPAYPALAQQAHVEGDVLVRFIINVQGNTEEVTIGKDSGMNMGFEEHSISAVKQWKYQPALLFGEPVKSRDSALIEFRLTNP